MVMQADAGERICAPKVPTMKYGWPECPYLTSSTGFLLMRVLTTDYEAEKAVVEPARRTLQCAQG